MCPTPFFTNKKPNQKTMLYINDELISTRNKNENYAYADIVKEYNKTIKEAQEYYGEFLNIETSVRPRKDNKTRALRYPGPRGLLLVSTVNRHLDNGEIITETIRYSPVLLKNDDNGQLKHDNPNLLVHKGVYSFRIKDNPDLAYFVLTCGKVGKTPAEGKKFHLYDVKKIYDDNYDRRRLEGSVLNLIYSSLPEGKLRTLAKSFGVGDVNLKDIKAVSEELFNKLMEAEEQKKINPESKARGFKEFIESSEVKLHDQITALCYDAKEKESLIYNEDERRWEIDYKDGGQPYILKELAGNEYGDPMGSLVSYLLSEQNKLRKLEGVMGLAASEGVPKEKEVPKITAEMVLKEHKVPVLKKWLRELDPTADIKQNAKAQPLKEALLARIPAE